MLAEVLREIVEFIVRLYGEYEPIIKFISYVVSPLLALLAFRRNRHDRKELVEQGQQLGQSRAEAEQAHKEASKRQEEAEAARQKLEARGAEIAKLENDLRNITEGADTLWKLRPAKPFPEYKTWLRDPKGAKLVTIGNLKGGVGKTTIAANLAAYVSETRQKPVLIVDLDYQASLSNSLLLAAGREEVESRVERLFDETADLIAVERASVHLVPELSQAWLVPSDYNFSATENRLLLKWLLKDDGGIDVRYRLAHALLRPEVRQGYELIILDMPPRMTLGSVNALVASHFLVVPTIHDKLSAEAVSQFLIQMRSLKKDLDLDLELAGIVGTMSRGASRTPNEQRAWDLVKDGSKQWRDDEDLLIDQPLPRRADIAAAAGEDVAYTLPGADGQALRQLFDPLFATICARIGLN